MNDEHVLDLRRHSVDDSPLRSLLLTLASTGLAAALLITQALLSI
jgi:hypothetical protein